MQFSCKKQIETIALDECYGCETGLSHRRCRGVGGGDLDFPHQFG